MTVKHIMTAALGFTFLVASCGSTKNIEIAEKGVVQFHTELDSEQYAVIYAAADEGLRKATTEADFTHLLQSVHRKLGRVEYARLLNFGDGFFTGQGRVITIIYDTTFAGGTGTEQFVWHIRENRLVLFGYHINSNALFEK